MDLYIYRLARIGFSFSRAYEVCLYFMDRNELEELDRYINNLEDSWSAELCG